MEGYIENTSLPIQPFSSAQASALDSLFPGFTLISTAVHRYLSVDVSVYAPQLCFLGLLVFGCLRLCKYFVRLLETYCTSTIHLRYREDAYDIFMLWTASQTFAQNARSSLVTTDLASSLNRSRNDHSNGGDANKKPFYYTPWNGRFFMWYKGRLLVFRRQYRSGDFSSREEVSISCFGRSPQILRELLSECRTEYAKLVQGKTCLYEHHDGKWMRSVVSNTRRISTVILDESTKAGLLEDITEFLEPASQEWYSDRGIPYRRGYLLYGPPGTGKSSLSSSIAGHFGLDIYILSLPTVNEGSLKSLFSKLPNRCIILLEDIDAVTLDRDTQAEDFSQIVTGSPSLTSKSVGGKVALSSLLNVIDGVASQDGRILIMTTNHIARLDKALIRPGRVDKKVELGLADQKMTAALFGLVFKPVDGDAILPNGSQSGENSKAHDTIVSPREEAERLERLAKDFAIKVPELKLSPAEIFSFLLEHKSSPKQAIDNVSQLISKLNEVESKSSKAFEDTKPEYTQLEITQDSRWDKESSTTEAPTEMVQISLVSPGPTTPPSSPNFFPSKCDAQELERSIRSMEMPSHTSPKEHLGVTRSSSPNACVPLPKTLPSSQVVTTEIVQGFVDALKFLAKQEPPLPTAPEADASEDAEPEKVVARASVLAFKEVNEIWDDKAYKYTVVETPTPLAIDALDQYVFVVRGRTNRKSKETTYYIDIKSCSLRDYLRQVLCDVPGISILEEKPSIERNLLYHFLPEIEACYSEEVGSGEQTRREHVKLLVDYIKLACTEITQRLEALLQGNEITYGLLWALFKPNTLVYTTCEGTKKPRCIRYESGEEKTAPNGSEFFHIKAHYVEFDGKSLGKAPIETVILKFAGSRRINSLDAFPLHHHEGKETVMHELVECGRKFCSLTGVHHRQYKGKAFQMKKGRPVEVTINSRIIVDAVMFQDINPNYARPSILKKTSDTDLWQTISNSSTQPDESAWMKGMDVDKMSDEDLQLCSPTVLGFSLEDKLWLEFAVADITEISWDESIFDHLQIPSATKDLVRALTTQISSQEKAQQFDDFVKGKGRGINILLYGPPGVGKTMTAEALSELLHKPLFTVSAANFSSDAAALEKQLSGMFELTNNWDALLLLDEADASLRKRSSNSHHNSVVSVFLRKLEYFQGIMILTTNRVTDFDDAVQSRIHIGIPYRPLGPDTRRIIWDSLLKRVNTEDNAPSFSTKALEDLAKHDLNGRQIKNTVRAGHALATFEKSSLCITHVQKVLDVGRVFEEDFRGTGKLDYLNSYT